MEAQFGRKLSANPPLDILPRMTLRFMQGRQGAHAIRSFDQNDLGALPLADQYENRLRLIEFYDRSGFRTYHPKSRSWT